MSIFKKTITKFIAFILILLVILSIFFYWSWHVKQLNKAKGFYYVYKGDKSYKINKLNKAINYYNQGLNFYPEHTKARCNLGNIFVRYEDFYSAVNSYETALKYKPDFIICRMNLGIIESEKLANYDSAIIQYDTIIKTKPRIIQIPLIFSNWKSTKQNKAIASYNKGLAYRGKSLYMGEGTRISKQYLEKAEEAYKYAAKTLKKSYNTHYNLALTNHLLGDYKEAGLMYCKAINIEPMNFDAHYNLGILLAHLGRNKEALIEFEKAAMLLDLSGDSTKTKYIYDVISEVNQKISLDGDYEFLKTRDVSNTNTNNSDIILKNGKISFYKKDDSKFKHYMKTCVSKDFFKDYGIDE